MKGLKINSNIFSRLIVTFLLIIIPIYLLGIFMYFWGVNAVKTEISNSMVTQVSYYLNELEREVQSIKMLQYDCLSDENLRKLAIRGEIMNLYEKLESMKQLQQRLVTIRNSSPYIKDVTAHIKPIGKSVSANDSVVDIEEDKFENIQVQQGTTGAQIIKYEERFYLTTLEENRVSNNSHLFSIEVEIDEEALIETLGQLNVYEDGGIVLAYWFGNEMVTDQTDEMLTLPIVSILDNTENPKVQGIKTLMIEGKSYYVAYAKSDYLNNALFRYMPEEYVMLPLKKIYIWIWIFSISSILICIIYSLATYKYMHKPLSKLVKAFKKVEQGNMDIAITHDAHDEFEYLYSRFNTMVKKIKMLINQVYKQKILMQRAELKQLQSQINPHFLYNSFFIINTMARIGDENLIWFTKQLGEYFRFVTRNSSDIITLQEEVNHARVYTEIQQMRFSKRLTVIFNDLPKEFNKLKVPRLILQPIIENTFEHAIEKKMNGILSIDFMVKNNQLDIIVEDNGDNKSYELVGRLNDMIINDDENSEITGLMNINRRIHLMFGSECGIHFKQSELGGIKVILSIRISGD